LAFPGGDVALRMGELLQRGSTPTEILDNPMLEVYVLAGRNGPETGREPPMTEDETLRRKVDAEDDAEGQAKKKIDAEDDAEGQAKKKIDAEDDAEGQRRVRISDTEDDAEGQAKKKIDAEDDAEGQRMAARRLDAEDDAEGQTIRRP
jgi:hypothetical protein